MKKRKSKVKKLPELQYLLENYEYDPLKGTLTRKKDGKEIGWDHSGYRQVSIKGKNYALHRIVFYMFHRRDPGKKVIDHIDGNKSNNAILNLRCVAQKDNLRNTAERRKTEGLPKCEPGAWRVFAMPVKDALAY